MHTTIDTLTLEIQAFLPVISIGFSTHCSDFQQFLANQFLDGSSLLSHALVVVVGLIQRSLHCLPLSFEFGV